jgi:hypothetical protein
MSAIAQLRCPISTPPSSGARGSSGAGSDQDRIAFAELPDRMSL